MKFETKIAKLGIKEEVESIIANCECGEITSARIVEISKLRNFEIEEVIGDYLNWIDKDDNEVEPSGSFYCRLDKFCETFAISENRIAEFYAKGISEGGYEIAYAINSEVVLVLE